MEEERDVILGYICQYVSICIYKCVCRDIRVCVSIHFLMSTCTQARNKIYLVSKALVSVTGHKVTVGIDNFFFPSAFPSFLCSQPGPQLLSVVFFVCVSLLLFACLVFVLFCFLSCRVSHTLIFGGSASSTIRHGNTERSIRESPGH